MRKLDSDMKKSDELLSQMIPKHISDKIKSGSSLTDVCEVLEEVTIVCNAIQDFVDISSKCDGLVIIQLLNDMFNIFDVLTGNKPRIWDP